MLGCGTSPTEPPAKDATGAGGVEATDVGGAAGASAEQRADDRPILVLSQPRLGAEDLYPAPLTASGGEQLRLRFVFSAPLTANSELELRGGTNRPAALVEWSDGGKQLELVIAGDLSSGRPLEDDTRYALDLSGLHDEYGRALEPDHGLEDGVFWFVTGRHDALLNHACGHTFFGPFASGAAGETPEPGVLDIGATHVQYSITLPPAGVAFAGWVRANFATQAEHRLYFDAEASVSLAAGSDLSLVATPAASACAGITHELTLAPPFSEPFFLYFQPQALPTRRVIAELIPP